MAGTMRKVGNNKYRLEYMIDGERFSQNVTAKNDREAGLKLDLFVAEINNGNYISNSSMTFVEFAQLWLDKFATSNLSPTTVRDYKCRLNKYILDEIGIKKLNRLKRIHIQEFANKLIEEYNLSTKTAQNYIKLISSILSKAVEWDFIKDNVADKVSIPKNLSKEKKKVILYSYQEINLFINSLEKLEDKELQLAIYTSLTTGARRGEVLAICFKDFDFKKSVLHLIRNKVAIKDGVTIKDIKTGKTRMIYVPKPYIEKVKAYYKFMGSPDISTPLFSMHPDTYSKKFKEFLKDNNLREINLKDLRALNESILINQGMDIVATSKRLGHLPTTAINYYLDQIPEEDKKSGEIIGEVFFDTITPNLRLNQK